MASRNDLHLFNGLLAAGVAVTLLRDKNHGCLFVENGAFLVIAKSVPFSQFFRSGYYSVSTGEFVVSNPIKIIGLS